MSYPQYPKYSEVLVEQQHMPDQKFQQRIPDRSLVTNDIMGAQSKKLHYYVDRKLQNNVINANQERLIPKGANNSFENYTLGRRQYQYDMMKIPHTIAPQGADIFVRGKKHYQSEEGEIKQYSALENRHDVPNPQSDEFDRALQTKDIDGAVPGTLISKVVKNKETAQKIKLRLLEDKLKMVQNEEDEYEKFVQRTAVKKPYGTITQQTGKTIMDDLDQKFVSPRSEQPKQTVPQDKNQSDYLEFLYAELVKERKLNANNQNQVYNQEAPNKSPYNPYEFEPPQNKQQRANSQQDFKQNSQESQKMEESYAKQNFSNVQPNQIFLSQQYPQKNIQSELNQNSIYRGSGQLEYSMQQSQLPPGSQYPNSQPQRHTSLLDNSYQPQSQTLNLSNKYDYQQKILSNQQPKRDHQLETRIQLEQRIQSPQNEGFVQADYKNKIQPQSFSNNGSSIINEVKNMRVDIIGNYLQEKPSEYRVKIQDYNLSRQQVGLDLLKKVPAAQYKPRPY